MDEGTIGRHSETPGTALTMRLVTDILIYLVSTQGLTTAMVAAMIDDGLDALIEARPEDERALRQIAAEVQTAVSLTAQAVERGVQRRSAQDE